jgi:membrane protein required for colicin V production
MNWLDIIITILLVWGAFMGFRRGFFYAASSLAGFILGIFLGAIIANAGARVFMHLVDWNPMIIMIILFIITFVLIIIVFNGIGILLTNLFKALGINILNRLVGIAFGFLKYAFLISFVFMVLHWAEKYHNIMPQQAIENSYLYDIIQPLAPQFIPGPEFLEVPERSLQDVPYKQA